MTNVTKFRFNFRIVLKVFIYKISTWSKVHRFFNLTALVKTFDCRVPNIIKIILYLKFERTIHVAPFVLHNFGQELT